MTMHLSQRKFRAFTLVELLVTVTIIGIVAALLAPALSQARARERQTETANRLRQWSLGLTMYANDNQDQLARESFLPNGVTLNTWTETVHPFGSDVWYNGIPMVAGMRPAGHFAARATRGDFYRRSQVFHCPDARFPDRAASNIIVFFSLAMNSKLITDMRDTIKIAEILSPARTVAFLENRLKGETMADPEQTPFQLGQPSAYASRFVVRHRGRGNLGFVDGHFESFRASEVIRHGLAHYPQTSLVWTADPAADPNDN